MLNPTGHGGISYRKILKNRCSEIAFEEYLEHFLAHDQYSVRFQFN